MPIFYFRIATELSKKFIVDWLYCCINTFFNIYVCEDLGWNFFSITDMWKWQKRNTPWTWTICHVRDKNIHLHIGSTNIVLVFDLILSLCMLLVSAYLSINDLHWYKKHSKLKLYIKHESTALGHPFIKTDDYNPYPKIVPVLHTFWEY